MSDAVLSSTVYGEGGEPPRHAGGDPARSQAAGPVDVGPGSGRAAEATSPAATRRFEDELGSRRGLLRASLMILLDERPGHGYDLLTRLEPLGYDRSNPGRIYRALRWLESASYVEPTWETTGVGPARRVYELTTAGKQALEVAAANLKRHMKTLDPNLARYMQSRLRMISSTKQSFDLLVETRFSVNASDEASARRKIERFLGQPRPIEPDIRATGHVWVYENDPGS